MNTSPGPDTRAWLPAFLANAVIWGSSFLFIKVAVSVLHPTWIAAGRTIAGALTMIIILLVMRDKLPRDPKVWGHMIVPGVIGTALPFTLFAYGEERIVSLLAGIWNATTALWVLPFAVLVFRTEKFSFRAAVGLLLGFAGVLVVMGFWNAKGGDITGQIMCGIAALCYGISIPYVRKYVSGKSATSGVALGAMQAIVAAVASTIAALVLSGLPPAPVHWGWKVTGSVLMLGIFASGIALALNMRVIKLAGASTTAFVTYLIPVVAVILGVVVLGESLAWNQPVGALIVLIGVAIAQGVFSRKRVSATQPIREAALTSRR